MTKTIAPFIIVQLTHVLHTTFARRFATLLSLILAVSILLSILIHQVQEPNIQKRRLALVKHKHVMSGILEHLRKCSPELINDKGEANEEVLRKIYKEKIDKDGDQKLSASELRELIIKIQIKEGSLSTDSAALTLMLEFDEDGDTFVDVEEFIAGVSKWLNLAKYSTYLAGSSVQPSSNFTEDYKHGVEREEILLGEVVAEAVDNYKSVACKAVLQLVLGTGILYAFASSFINSLLDFSTTTGIPSFFVSFIILPWVLNSMGAVFFVLVACEKNLRSTSLIFSEVYRMVALNNIIRIIVFLSLIYFKNLTWDFSAEVLPYIIICTIIGGFTSLRITYPLWIGLVAILLYPISLALIYILNNVCGWA